MLLIIPRRVSSHLVRNLEALAILRFQESVRIGIAGEGFSLRIPNETPRSRSFGPACAVRVIREVDQAGARMPYLDVRVGPFASPDAFEKVLLMRLIGK